MTDINKIFVKSSLTIEKGYANTLCFLDGLVVHKKRYALENNQISIYQNSENYLSLFYNLNNSRTYYFEKILDVYGAVVTGEDDNGNTLQKVIDGNIIVFVDGILLRKDEYQIIDQESLSLSIKLNDSKTHQVIIYVSNTQITYGTLENLDVPDNISDNERPLYEQNRIGYNKKHTLIFKNGKLINTPLISNVGDYVKINIEKGPDDVIEYYQLNKSTISYNFQTSLGVMTYGPIDDYAITIPVLHDSYVVFDELAKISVDNIRPGFIIREANSGGKIIVVDTDFDKPRIKTITLQDFSTNYYTSGEYYVEVPEAKSIVDYMAEYEQKYSFLPEILRIFQRLLLDEVHDEVARLRSIRNIHEIDNENVNKLINLLGLDLDIKHLNDKQRREALEELTNFFRTAGTKNSYNYFNVIQDSAKIISMKQLFTYHKPSRREEGNRIYSYNLRNGSNPNGTGYFVGEKYKLIDIFTQEQETPLDLDITVTSVDQNGAITGFTTNYPEGTVYLPDYHYPLRTCATGAIMNCYSTPIEWRCDISLGGNQREYEQGNVLTSTQFPQNITVSTVDGQGRITSYTPTTINSNTPYELVDVPLTTDLGNLKIRINQEVISEELVFEKTTPGTFTYTPTDPKAEYRYEISGGGGSGGASDSSYGNYYDIEAAGGSRGEFKGGTFQCTAGTPVTIYVGGGGQPSYARGNESTSPTAGDAGQGYGSAAQRGGTKSTVRGRNNTSIPVDLRRYTYGFWLDGHNQSKASHVRSVVNSASGSGGGASAIVINGEAKSVARGGNGGTADYAGTIRRTTSLMGSSIPIPILYKPTMPGGLGGEGGGWFTDNRGAAGGGRNNSDTFRSYAGANGYVKIWKRTFRYTPTLINNHNLPYHNGEELATPNEEIRMIINHIYNGTIFDYPEGYTINPTTGTYPFNGTEYPIYSNKGGATLTVHSTPIRWRYNVSLEGDQANYFTNPPDNIRYLYDGVEGGSHNFTVSINAVDGGGRITNFNYSPTEGTTNINFNGRPTWVTHGNNATIRVIARTDVVPQQSNEREYIDFYLPEEVGAISHLEYRIPILDYGSVAQGSTNSPDPQIPGEPDIDYGSVAQDPEFGIDYGFVKDQIFGEWVEWLEWERPKYLYPTNHVEIETIILAYEKYDTAISRFYKQFYELASTVLYIHNLITVFSFGNYAQASQNDSGNPNGDERILMGIMTFPVQSYDIHCLTSDPAQDNV